MCVVSIVHWTLSSGACSLLVQVDKKQCSQISDCTVLGISGACVQDVCVATRTTAGAVGDGARSCGVQTPCKLSPGETCFKEQCADARAVEPFVCSAEVPERSEKIAFTFHVQEFVSTDAPRDLSIRACRSNDVSCLDPLDTFVDSSGLGEVSLELPVGFMGFLEVHSDALPALYYFTRPLVTTTRAKSLQLIAPDSLELLAKFSGKAVAPDTGLVVLEAFDCEGRAAGGIHFDSSKSGAQSFYIVNLLPSVETDATVRDDANDGAIGGFLNAEPGNTIFSARIGVGGPLLAQFNANVRAGTVTYIDLHP